MEEKAAAATAHHNKACELILDIYERMEDEEQKAFDMGQSYRAMLEVKEELTRIGNGGDNNG